MENSELCKAGIEHKYILYWTGEKVWCDHTSNIYSYE